MNILFFTHEKAYGGASKALVTLIDELLKNSDNKIYVVIPFKHSKIKQELINKNITIINKFYSWWQIPVNIPKWKQIIFRILYKLNFLSEYILTKEIRKLKIDIIHSNTSVIDMGARIANKLKIPHVWHFREFTGKHLKFIKSEDETYDYINNYGNKIIYISKAIQDFYNDNILSQLGTLIYDGPSAKNLCKKKYDDHDVIEFLLVGTLEKNKGQEIAILAAKELINKNITNFRLLLAGGDPTKYSDYLFSLIKKYKLENNVEYIGFVSNMKALRKKVDVELMCAPSEAFGLVTIEAMMNGNPVIGSNSGATSELVVDGKNGFLFKRNDYKDLALKMEKIIENSNLISTMGLWAYNYSKENFTSKKNADETINLYNQIVREN